VNFDILHRWLKRGGYKVLFCRNVTDIEDKILVRSRVEGIQWWRITGPAHRAFDRAYSALGCLPPSVEPRATGHIPEMIELVEQLLAGGHAYEVEGNVYFSVDSFPHYGALSRQRSRHMRVAEDDDRGKRDPRDFALWKRARPGEPFWNAPWGEGRPGWHLECSAMARRYLGAEFDIHGGGANLIFPHHENEMAQSLAAGDSFARLWMHNGPVTHRGEKIRKKPRNPLAVSALLNRVRPVELRYYLAAAHYRSPMEFSVEAVEEAATAYRRVERFVLRLSADNGADGVGGHGPCREAGGEIPAGFAIAMNNDLNVPQALSVVHQDVADGHAALNSGDRRTATRKSHSVRAMLSVLGLDPLSEMWAREGHLHEVAGAVLRLARDLTAAALADGKHERARSMQRQIDTALRKRRECTQVVGAGSTGAVASRP
jgi:cysteinyl-tRNA synthetase